MRIVLDDLRENWEECFLQFLPQELHPFVIYLDLEKEKNGGNEQLAELAFKNAKPQATHMIYAVTAMKHYKLPLTFLVKIRERLLEDFRAMVVFDPSLRDDQDYDAMYAYLRKDYPDRVMYWDQAVELFREEIRMESV